ncbi:FadR/GntR family transcriptional regulator [Mycolicibacterium komossense]|uniref:GntR family transcriptional regulator n=1 Tax=Mycolicibacterium komossense TaxID=1779 RepID=A0ABT3CBV9_9MYCO|nr:GntR family transcriptional regulator [Mycolicibacterium komossense]MCV7226970.1 GntR family transcriptional regulator [Mycolicibacterium komossense]
MIFSPLEHGGRTQLVFDRLRSAVALDVFKDGEQLPPETELAAQLGISPVTLRDALALMRQAGLVETRRGRTGGSFIRRDGYDPVAHGYSRLQEMSLVDIRDLSDWRISVAGAAAALAAERASDDEVNGMQSHVGTFARAKDSTSARRTEGRLSISLAAASQSVRLTRATVTCVIDYGPLLSVAYSNAKLRKTVGQQHKSLLEAVRDGRHEDALRAARNAGIEVARDLAGQRVDSSARKPR